MRASRLFRNRDFRTLMTAQMVSLFGDHTYWLVFLFVAGKVAKENWQVGLVMAFTAVPFMVLGPTAGVVADRFDRRLIMALTDLFSFLITLALAIVAVYYPYPPIWMQCVFCGALSCVNAFFMPARMAALPKVVPVEDLAEANSVVMLLQQTVSMLGIAASALGIGAVFDAFPNSALTVAALVNSATFLVSGLYVVRLPNLSADREGDHPAHGWTEFKHGVRTVFSDKVLRIILPANVLSQCFISGFMVVYVVVNRAWFGGRYATLGWIEFSFAASVALMGFFIGRFKVTRPGLAFALATAFIGLTVLAMGWAQNVWLFVLWNVLAGLALPFAWVPIQVYIQSAFKDEVRGRVSSAWVSTQMTVQPVGLLGIGPLLDWLGLTGAFVVMGGGMSVAGLLGLSSRATRDERLPAEVQAENGKDSATSASTRE